MDKAVIVGVGETLFTRDSEATDEELMVEALTLALNDAGLSKDEVQGLAIGTMDLKDDSPLIAEHLGFQLGWILKADYGGASGVISLARARQAIEAGYVDVIVTVAGGNRNAERRHDVEYLTTDYARRNWIEPFAFGGPNSNFGLIQRLHMERYGTTVEQLGKIATTFRKHAQLNERALLRKELTLDDYVNSRLIADPIRLFDCVMPCTGAIAIVLASEKIANRLNKQPVYLGPYAEYSNHQTHLQSPDRLETGFVKLQDRLFADLDRSDIDFLQLYDDYPIAVLMTMEDLGFTSKGEGGKFLDATDISAWGELPINTGGGQLSIGQPAAAGGYIHIAEAIHQLRGDSGDRQVADAKVGLVSGIGLMSYLGNLAVTAATVLSKDPL